MQNSVSRLTYSDLEKSIIEWAQSRPDVHAVFVVGSRARITLPADEWSDLDLVLFASDLSIYTQSGDWLATFGSLQITFFEQESHPEWYALYQGDLKADLSLFQAPLEAGPSPSLQSLVDAFPYPTVLSHGMRVLFARNEGNAPLVIPPTGPDPLPSPEAFQNEIHGFLFAVLTAAKTIRRGDLWRAGRWLNGEVQDRLLNMLEWHTRAANPSADVWYDGRFLNHWASPRALERISEVFATYSQQDMLRALSVSLELYSVLAGETAEKLGFPAPQASFRTINHILSRLFEL